MRTETPARRFEVQQLFVPPAAASRTTVLEVWGTSHIPSADPIAALVSVTEESPEEAVVDIWHHAGL